MDRVTKLSRVYQESHVDSRTQRDQLRLSSIEQGLGDYDSDEPSSGYTGYVKTVKPYKGRGTQPSKSSKARKPNQEGVRRFRGRPNS